MIPHRALSRKHARIFRGSDGRWWVEDLNSHNGVLLNGERVSSRAPLLPDSDITLGDYRFRFEAEGAPAPVKATVVLRFGGIAISRHAVSRGTPATIGRAETCDVHIPEPKLSRAHCRIEFDDGLGRFVVRDLGSQNGTYVNRVRVEAPTALSSGDRLNFAEYELIFLLEGAAGDAQSMDEDPDLPLPGRGPAGHTATPSTQGARVPGTARTPRAKIASLGEPFVRAPRRPRGGDPAAVRRPPGLRPGDVPDATPPPRDAALSAWFSLREAPDGEEDASGLMRSGAGSRWQGLLAQETPDDDDVWARDGGDAKRDRARRFVCEVSGEAGPSRRLALDQPVTIIGTTPDAHIRLVDGPRPAKRHSLLVRVGDSLLLVRLGSASVARVNGFPRLQAFLRDGDVIEIEDLRLRISVGAAPLEPVTG